MNILVTGSAGFTGQVLMAQLKFDSSDMSYEMFRIKNFHLTVPSRYGWKPKVRTLQDGLLI